MGALRFYWKSQKVDLHSKYLIYQAIPINLLLWGCESWALTKVLISKLEVFHNRCIRSILEIKWDEVRELKITNVQIRKKFYNIDSVENQVSKRRLHFLGKVIRMPCKKIPARLISAFMKNIRPQGRPNNTIRHSFLNDVSKIIPNVDQFGSFNTWAHVAHNLIHWSFLVNNLHKFEPEPCNTDTNPDTNPDRNSPDSKSSLLPQSPPPPPSPPPPLSPLSPSSLFSDNPFKVFGINLTSTVSEVKTTFRRLARLYHPDKWNSSKKFTSEEGSEKFKHISNAYQSILSSCF